MLCCGGEISSTEGCYDAVEICGSVVREERWISRFVGFLEIGGGKVEGSRVGGLVVGKIFMSESGEVEEHELVMVHMYSVPVRCSMLANSYIVEIYYFLPTRKSSR